ncbi:MAG: hypothetical protein GOVbin7581_10 [Prokaryotic dsDNA virus sp.]|nr:MAG: hypothetical protein GOVbin7581_10 [Prokaryotic dsDNA virus sp.]|tara:strand:+ start:4049 stop:4315 length:267 start_codon:yes stop_codon:yes gene_type:complete
MKKHTKIYLNYFGYAHSQDEYIPCEVCERQAVDIHHIIPRGMGGSKTKDYIENLVALCRECHIRAERDKSWNEVVKAIHLTKLKLYEK